MRQYISYSLERAVKTVAQTAVAVLTASEVVSIINVDWVGVLGVSVLAGIMSLLTSVANYKPKGLSGLV